MRRASSSNEWPYLVGKYLSAIVVFVAVTALALLGFLIPPGTESGSIQAATGGAATSSSWLMLIAGLAVASALALYLALMTRRRLIEEHLRSERAKLETLLVSAHRVETMAQMVGGIAHDFNNVLMTVSGYASLALAKSEESDDTEMQEYLNLVSLSADNGTRMIKKLLSFSRSKSRRRTNSTELLPSVQTTVDLLSQLLPEHIAVQVEVADQLPVLKFDSLILEQIVINLLVNASESIERSGKIHVSLAPVTVDDIRCNACQQTFAGQFVRLTVSDTGKGLSLENMDEIFQPFYTTKNEDRGAGQGLGMALVQNLVHGIGGHIELGSTPGKGTVVSVFLPVPAAIDGNAETAH